MKIVITKGKLMFACKLPSLLLKNEVSLVTRTIIQYASSKCLAIPSNLVVNTLNWKFRVISSTVRKFGLNSS